MARAPQSLGVLSMLMQKIRDNAVWVVGIAVVSLGALIFVDWGMSADNGLRHKNIVASVGNEDIPYEEFESALREQEKSMNESGQEIAPEQRAMMRRQVLEQIVQTRLFDRLVKTYALQGTAEQVLNHLRRNPPPGMPKALVEDMLRLLETEKSRSKGGSNPPMPNDSKKR